MYLGIVLMLLGVAIATGGVLFYAASLAFYLVIDYVFCPYEEAKLAQTFGNRFTRYRDSVRRWL
jgi:protein-S-isoprenylcysteine O-methyltransferase Ste14